MARVPSGLDDLFKELRRQSRFQDFEALMSLRVENIILVSSLYDKFILQEDGQLSELILSEFLDLRLHHTTGLTHVPTGSEALDLAREDARYNLIVTAIDVGDMNAIELAQEVHRAGLGIPVIVLAYDAGQLADFTAHHDTSDIDRLFLWQGDTRILLAIVKYVEDKLNVDHDTRTAGVQVIPVIEDSVRHYSSFLPMMYTEVISHSRSLLPEGLNLAHNILRMRARPKILHCISFEEAWDYFVTYQEDILGVISDIEFPREDRCDPTAGAEFARRVHQAWPDVPIVLQSSRLENKRIADSVGAHFLHKESPTLIHDLRRLMIEQFSFGDFVFRMPDGREIGRATDMRTLVEGIETIPDESVVFHAERNHFSRWLKARTEFALAHRLRPRRADDFESVEDIRRDLVTAIEEYRQSRTRSLVADFDRHEFDATSSFSRIGAGSLGGKARSLAFMRYLVNAFELDRRFSDVRISIPPSVVLGTEVFDDFLDRNNLRDFAINTEDDDEILHRFVSAELPPGILGDLESFLEIIEYPLAVRSSSLLDDSQYQPLAGVYETFMLPNNHPELDVRVLQLQTAIKHVYASTFSQHAKSYLRATSYRLEEERMAVMVQQLVGHRHGDRFYPDFSGVARSYNFYPTGPAQAEDGVVTVALGLGRTVVMGEKALSFCPKYPEKTTHLATPEDILQNSQREFWAVNLGALDSDPRPELWECRYSLDVAEKDETLGPLASTYSAENDAVHDGISRPGVRLITFAPLLKFDLFPLADIIEPMLEMGARGMNKHVEIEFAADLGGDDGEAADFALLQIRPMGISWHAEELDLDEFAEDRVLCRSGSILGNGERRDLYDAVIVNPGRFERGKTKDAAREIAFVNARLVREDRPYLLAGPGRWGSADPWLGIPVRWDEIAGAKVIVESEFADVHVAPSQGTHFFQNLTSFRVGYFTVAPTEPGNSMDWEWLAAQPGEWEGEYVRHLRFPSPLRALMDGATRKGVILKPEERTNG